MVYRVVLIRHGESEWNKENRFNGWVDTSLSEKGIEEAEKAGELLKKEGFSFDLAFSSVLKRDKQTLDIILKKLGQEKIKTIYSWKLNERHYGALQGLNKAETALKYGEEQVKIWRRSYDVRPPALSKLDSMYPGKDPLYKDLKEEEIPLAESLKDVVTRVIPFWEEEICSKIRAGKKIIIVGHGNSFRALVKYLENVSDKDIVELNIPTGIPFVYELDNGMRLISRKFLGDSLAIKKAMETIANQGRVI